MTSYRGHVNYGTAPKPAAKKLIGFSASAAKKAEARAIPIERSPRKPRPSNETVYQWLLECAKSGQRAPQHDDVVNKFGAAGNLVVRDLVREGRIVIEIGHQNYRVIYLGILQTKGFPSGAKVYRRLDKDGDHWYRGNGKWDHRA